VTAWLSNKQNVKIKVSSHSNRARRPREGARVGGWSTPLPGRFTPGKDPVPQEAGWAQDRSRQVRKISSPPVLIPGASSP